MITFKLIRKIGKILRGGAGRKEIILGTLFGALIGFNPDFNFTLLITFLLALILNANFSFIVLGAAVGKLLSLPAAAVSFHIGFAIIHSMGLENLFRSLCNAPLTALMDLNVYAMIGSLPLALITGLLLGLILGSAVVNIRKKMLDADQHEIIGKTFGNKVSRLLLRLAFGKSKLSLDDEIPRQAPWLRKSGLIMVGIILFLALVVEGLLLDTALRKGLESSIASVTGAEVNVAHAHFSFSQGKIAIEGLQLTDPDRPTHNMVQVDRLVADLNVGELLSRTYAIDLLSGSTMKRDVLRKSPGTVYDKVADRKPEEVEEKEAPGKSLEDYLSQGRKWQQYADKAYRYLEKRKVNAKRIAKGEKPEISKEEALASAKQLGYLNASADLFADRPSWLIHKIEITDVQLGGDLPVQTLTATEVSSHPELNGQSTKITLSSMAAQDPIASLVLRFDDPSAQHAGTVSLTGMPLGNAFETSDSLPVDIRDGKVDIRLAGRFSADSLNLPFTLVLHDLKADVEEGEEIMGMDSQTATEVFSSMAQLEIEGALGGSLLSPRVTIDYDKLTKNMKDALLAAGKKELANRANAEMDKAKEELKKQVGEEISEALSGEEGESVEDKAKDAIRGLF